MKIVMLKQTVISPGKVGFLPGEDTDNESGVYDVDSTVANQLLAKRVARLARQEDIDTVPAKVVKPLKQEKPEPVEEVEPQEEEEVEEVEQTEEPANIDGIDSLKWKDLKEVARSLSLPCNMKKEELIAAIREAQAQV